MAKEHRRNGIRRETPLRMDELERIASDPRLPGDREAGQVLLGRLLATLREQQSRMRVTQAEVERLRRQQASASHPVQRALDAIAALDDGQKREILDRNYLSAVAELERQRQEATLAQVAAHNYRLRVQHLLGCLLEEDLPTPVHVRIQQALHWVDPAAQAGKPPSPA